MAGKIPKKDTCTKNNVQKEYVIFMVTWFVHSSEVPCIWYLHILIRENNVGEEKVNWFWCQIIDLTPFWRKKNLWVTYLKHCVTIKITYSLKIILIFITNWSQSLEQLREDYIFCESNIDIWPIEPKSISFYLS
jgi:hypothetical protein